MWKTIDTSSLRPYCANQIKKSYSKTPFVNFPAPPNLQSVSSIVLGLYIAFIRKPPFAHNGYSILVPPNAPLRTADPSSFLVPLIAGLNSYFLLTSCMPIEENQIIAASISVRLGMVLAIAGTPVVQGKSRFW
ncbi:hypothetical protein Vi05172_g9995 [Venturia inaequalis]|nr:hypothetical protein Vi05172_g9995 [Venturia inaequalis]